MSFHYTSWNGGLCKWPSLLKRELCFRQGSEGRWVALLAGFWRTHRISMRRGWRQYSRPRREKKEWHRGQHERVSMEVPDTVAHNVFSLQSWFRKLPLANWLEGIWTEDGNYLGRHNMVQARDAGELSLGEWGWMGTRRQRHKRRRDTQMFPNCLTSKYLNI